VLDGRGKLTLDGGGGERNGPVLWIAREAVAEIRGVTITGGNGPLVGAVYNGGTLTLIDSTVSGNEAHGGALGGGVLNDGVMALVNSTVSGNMANENEDYPECESECLDELLFDLCFTCQPFPGLGGGIHNLGELTVTNSTVSGNTANDEGGGIYNSDSLTLINSTVTGNVAHGGGAVVSPSNKLTIINTIILGDCELSGDGAVSGSGNIESPGNTCGLDPARNMVSVSEEQLSLGPLQDNSGPTYTHAPTPGSMAIDAIPEDDCVDHNGTSLDHDQRGVQRPHGGRCDVGAVEQ